MILITAGIDYTTGWTQIRFPFNRAVVDAVKTIPGSRWNPEAKAWLLPLDGLAALMHRHGDEIKLEVQGEARRNVPLPGDVLNKLRPYQIEGASFLTQRGGAILTLAPRLGKTATSLTAARALDDAELINALVIVYPNGVRAEWERQTQLWWPGGKMIPVLARGSRDDEYDALLASARQNDPMIIGIHYEILTEYLDEVRDLLAGKRYALIADEIHLAKNRKAPRTLALHALAERAKARWGLTGTPMRNRPRDLFSIFNFAIPQSCGRGYWAWAGAYCGAHQDASGHWDDFGSSNEAELKLRLSAISYRKTREEVAAHLPKADRSVVPCNIAKGDLAKYKKLEKALAGKIAKALRTDEPGGAEREALEALTKLTTKAKIPAAIERAVNYANQGLDVLVFCHHHATIDALEAEWKVSDAAADLILDGSIIPMFARGADGPPKRNAVIAEWKKQPKGGSVLFANTMSVNVGIDLSKADVGMFVELEWVPADYQQAEDRLVDVHLGSRTAPPIYETLIVENTVDQDMAAALLFKLRNIDQIVGASRDGTQLAEALRESRVAGSQAVLPSTDAETVKAALIKLRDRWLSEETATTSDTLAADMASTDWEERDADDDSIPF